MTVLLSLGIRGTGSRTRRFSPKPQDAQVPESASTRPPSSARESVALRCIFTEENPGMACRWAPQFTSSFKGQLHMLTVGPLSVTGWLWFSVTVLGPPKGWPRSRRAALGTRGPLGLHRTVPAAPASRAPSPLPSPTHPTPPPYSTRGRTCSGTDPALCTHTAADALHLCGSPLPSNRRRSGHTPARMLNGPVLPHAEHHFPEARCGSATVRMLAGPALRAATLRMLTGSALNTVQKPLSLGRCFYTAHAHLLRAAQGRAAHARRRARSRKCRGRSVECGARTHVGRVLEVPGSVVSFA